MASLAIFLRPDSIGLARMKSAGNNPCFAAPQWSPLEDAEQLLREPLMLASTIRELIGDENKYDIYLNVWPGAYRAIMFSYTKKNKKDLNRLRQSELETVFHGESDKLATYDLVLDKGRPSYGDKSRRMIFVTEKERIALMMETFKAQKLSLKRIAPMDATMAETALQFWAPKDNTISVSMMLDDACTSIAFMRGGVLQAIRTLPDGFGAVLRNYMTITGDDAETCRRMIRENGVHVNNEELHMPTIQDDVLRTVNKLAVEVIKNLHTTYGDEAVIGQVLLCGNFVHTVGLVEFLNSRFETECVVASPSTLSNVVKAVVADEAYFEELFPVALTGGKGADLLTQYKKNKSDKATSIVVCSVMGVALAALMAVTPVTKNNLQKQLDNAAAELAKPEYTTVQELMDRKAALGRHKNALTEAIAALPHGGTNTAGIIADLQAITAKYGTLLSISIDYNGKNIDMTFSTLNYDSFVYWQKEVTAEGRFSFRTPPTFTGNGLIYTVDAKLTATDFDPAAANQEG